MICQYLLQDEGDDSYTLVFNDDGSISVNFFKDYDQPYKKSHKGIVLPENYDKPTRTGLTIRQLVVKKLIEILPGATLRHPKELNNIVIGSLDAETWLESLPLPTRDALKKSFGGRRPVRVRDYKENVMLAGKSNHL